MQFGNYGRRLVAIVVGAAFVSVTWGAVAGGIFLSLSLVVLLDLSINKHLAALNDRVRALEQRQDE